MPVGSVCRDMQSGLNQFGPPGFGVDDDSVEVHELGTPVPLRIGKHQIGAAAGKQEADLMMAFGIGCLAELLQTIKER